MGLIRVVTDRQANRQTELGAYHVLVQSASRRKNTYTYMGLETAKHRTY